MAHAPSRSLRPRLDRPPNNREPGKELRTIAARAGWNVVKVYRDEGISGAKGRDERPAFDALCKDAARSQFDLVMAWSVDRLGRSLQDLIGFLSELHALGIDLMLHQQGLDTTTPAGKAMFPMIGVFAEFERAMIRERVKAGLEQARAQGRTLGRPTISAATDAAIRKALKTGDTGIQDSNHARRWNRHGAADQSGDVGLTISGIRRHLNRGFGSATQLPRRDAAAFCVQPLAGG
jgi:DNA invertase Pin-like site-specific DNA recombinase